MHTDILIYIYPKQLPYEQQEEKSLIFPAFRAQSFNFKTHNAVKTVCLKCKS